MTGDIAPSREIDETIWIDPAAPPDIPLAPLTRDHVLPLASAEGRGNADEMSLLDGEIRDGRHHMQVRVYYEDTDFSGIVYHANYLRFMERGRTNHLRLMGAEQHALFAEAQAETPGFAFVVRSMQIDFLKPARMDDVLDVVTWPVAVKGASITLAQEVRRGEDVLVKAQVRVAFISEGRAQPIPKSLRLLMKADIDLAIGR